jgi:hypothetical protein
LGALYGLLSGIDPTCTDILACSHLPRLQKLELLLDTRLLLLAPRYETIRRCHFCSGVLLLFPRQRASKLEVAGRLKADVRLWHKADMLNALTNVRFWGKADSVTRPQVAIR